jgi:hypothetical protein
MYAPGNENVSGQILARGISSAANSVADTITELGQQHKQAKALRVMAVDGLGMDPDQVDKMSLPELQGTLQSVAVKNANAQRQAQIEEIQARTNFMNERAGSADALGQMAPALDTWSKANPGKQPAAQDILGMMNGIKMDPRTQGVLLRDLLPQMMGGNNGEQPQNFRSAAGNPYVFMNHTLIPDRAGVDPSQFMDSAPPGMTALPNGKGGVTWKNTNRALPSTYDSRLSNSAGNGLVDQLGALQQSAQTPDADLLARPTIGGDPKKLATFKANVQKNITTLQKQIGNHVDSYAQQGYATPDFWDAERQRYGLAAPSASSSTPAASSSAGTGGAPASASPLIFKDKSGAQYQYKGTAADPMTDKNPANWAPVQQ